MRKLYLTYTLVLINAIIFMMVVATSTLSFMRTEPVGPSSIVIDLLFSPSYLLTGKNPYSIITHMFVHANLLHFIFNAFALFTLGLYFEEKVGSLRFGIIFFGTGVIAAFLYALGTNFQIRGVVGASGGLFGIIGAYARLYPRDRFAFFPLPLPLPIYTWAFIFFLGSMLLHFVPGLCLIPNVAHLAHVCGLFAGLAIAPLVMKIPEKEKKKRMTKVDYKALEEIAISEEDKALLEKIISEDEPEVRDAWLEHFLEKARCPRCGKKLDVKGRNLNCDCGFALKY